MIPKPELERVLGPLRSFLDGLDGLTDKQAEAASHVRGLLAKVLEAAAWQTEDDAACNHALGALALGVIEARRCGLSHLPMPAYDLWLPFKAGCGLHSKPVGEDSSS